MFVQRALVGRVERGQRVSRNHLFVVVVGHRQSNETFITQNPRLSPLPFNNSRNLIMPVLIRVFTVPSGAPTRAAISDWLSPSKYASSKSCFCSSGSRASTFFTT